MDCHRTQPENVFHRAQHAHGVVHGRVDATAARVGRQDEGRGAVRVDMVGAVLGVVFQDENGGLRPELRLRDRLHQQPERVVVVGDGGLRSDLAGADARGVIVAEPHRHEARHLAAALEFRQIAQEHLHAFDVGVVHVEAAELHVGVLRQRRVAHGGDLASRGRRRRDVGHPPAVVAEAQARLHGVAPDVAGRGQRGALAALVVVVAAARGVRVRPHALHVSGRDGGARPVVPVGADVGIDVEVVQQHELARQPVVVRRHFFSEQREGRIAVADAEITEHLVIGAVLLDDVDDVADGAVLAAPLERMSARRRLRGPGAPPRAVFEHLRGELRHLLGRRLVKQRGAAALDGGHILHRHVALVNHRAAHERVRALRVRERTRAAPVQHQQPPLRQHARRQRVPAHRNEALHHAAPPAQVDACHRIGVRADDVETVLVRRERKRARRHPGNLGKIAEQRHAD